MAGHKNLATFPPLALQRWCKVSAWREDEGRIARLLPAFNQPPSSLGAQETPRRARCSLKKEESKPLGRKPTRHHHTELKLNFYNFAVESDLLLPRAPLWTLSSLLANFMLYDKLCQRRGKRGREVLFCFLLSSRRYYIDARRGYFKRFDVEARY